MTRRIRSISVLSLACAVLGMLFAAAPALAAPVWKITSLSDTTAQPGGTLDYVLSIQNLGDETTSGEWTLRAILPAGFTGVEAQFFGPVSCPGVSGAAVVECHSSQPRTGEPLNLNIVASVPGDAGGVATAEFEMEGGEAPAAGSTVDPVRISESTPEFGIDAFDVNASDPSGAVFRQAAGHPSQFVTSLDFNTYTNSSGVIGRLWPVQATRDIAVELPPGFVGNANVVPSCSLADLVHTDDNGHAAELCSPDTQIGVVDVKEDGEEGAAVATLLGPIPVFNLIPPPGVPFRFGFAIGQAVIIFDVKPRSNGDYGLTTTDSGVSEGLAIVGSTLTLWGVPAAGEHNLDRSCPGEGPAHLTGGSCNSGAPEQPLFRMPTSCTGAGAGLPITVRSDSWANPGIYKATTIHTHETPAYPYAPEDWGAQIGTEGCGEVPFEPSLSASPTTNRVDSPSGLNVDLGVPQRCWEEGEAEATCQSDLKEADVTLPPGMTVNPSSAEGLGACAAVQVGLTTPVGQASPIHFDEAPARCPDSSKIGSVDIETPLLSEDLTGSVYLAEPSENPFGSLLAMYMVAEGSGVVIKQAGEIKLDPNTGRITTAFPEAPQLPFANLHLELFGGNRAVLRTPSSCGEYSTEATLSGWSGKTVQRSSAFEITNCPNSGFTPKLAAGAGNPLAGTTSPFLLRLTREDGEQELSGLQVTLPPGLSGYLKGIPYCPDAALAAVSGELGSGAAQEASPSCPPASQLGTVTVGAGAGANPFYIASGRAYLAGPYNGAPLSLAVIVPAVAGPFDLGSVLVRNALQINPETAQITTVSDPLPTILHGIPLDLRDVRVELNRPNFTLNPTSCDEMQIASTLTSTAGATASPSERFQVAGCEDLAFKPKLSLRLKGKIHRGGHPALSAVLRMPAGGANVARAAVTLPATELLENAHIRTVCTRTAYVAGGGGGEQCPKGSIYGHAKAYTPLLDQPLEGPVYLRSNGGERELPDLVASLRGQIQVDLVGYTDAVHGRLRTTFASVPDAPVSRFVLRMKGGHQGLMVNTTNLCRAKPRALALFDGHNGKTHDITPLVKVKCGRHKKRR